MSTEQLLTQRIFDIYCKRYLDRDITLEQFLIVTEMVKGYAGDLASLILSLNQILNT